jgi:quercetin dioxygenase-like cupin family protein
MSAFDDVTTLVPQQIWDGVVGRTVHGEVITLSQIELEPDSVVPEHSHPNEQVGILLRGSLTFTVGGEERRLGPGGTWRILANTPHDVRTGPDGATLVEAFSPVRADWEALQRLEPGRPAWLDPA